MGRLLLEYKIVVWSPHMRKHIENIERIHDLATKCLSITQNWTYKGRLKRLNLPFFAHRRHWK